MEIHTGKKKVFHVVHFPWIFWHGAQWGEAQTREREREREEKRGREREREHVVALRRDMRLGRGKKKRRAVKKNKTCVHTQEESSDEDTEVKYSGPRSLEKGATDFLSDDMSE